MILAALAHLLFLAGLAAAAILIWRRRATPGRGTAVLAAVVWLTGLLAVHASLSARGRAWLSTPVRRFAFELRPTDARGLGSHHRVIYPPYAKRFPAALREVGRPVSVGLKFGLQANGKIQHVTITRSSASGELGRAVATHVARWRFGPLPAGYEPRATETVELEVANRHEVLRRGGLAALLASAFVGLWMLTTWLLPSRARGLRSMSAETERATRKMLMAAGWLAGLGWLTVWRLTPDLGHGLQDLPIKQSMFLLANVLLIWASAWLAQRWDALRRAVARVGWWWVGAGVVLLLLTRFTPLGTDLNTGHRLWLRTPIGVFQTVELVKLLMVFFVAAAAYPAAFGGLVTTRGRHTQVLRLRPWAERYQGVMGAFALVLAALAVMSDFGPMLLLALVLLSLLCAQGHWRQSAVGLALLLAMLAGSYLVGMPPRWRERVSIWRDPWRASTADSVGLSEGREHMARVAWAVSAGGLTGAGLGQGLPDDIAAVESDFVFAAMGEELGWIGAAATLGFILTLTVTGLSLARQRRDAFEKALLSGIALLFGVQAALSIGGNLGLWPLTGITLPFVSYGGSSLLVNFLALGVFLGVANRRSDLRASEQPLPLDLGRQMDRSLHKLQIGAAMVFAALALKAAWLQSPWSSDRVAGRFHQYADGSRLADPRLDGPVWVTRGQFLDRDGRLLAQPRHFLHLVGVQAHNRQRVGLQSFLNDALVGRFEGLRGAAPIPLKVQRPGGYDVVLTLDQQLQDRAYQLLRGRKGSIVGIVPQTGEVVIAANRPALESGTTLTQWQASYDSRRDAPPFCYRKVYAPGSAFKTLIAAAALDTHAVSCDDRVECRGSYWPRGARRPIRDWQLAGGPDWRGHGKCSLSEALIPSCNSIFAQVGVELGWDKLSDFADRAGFNRPLPLAPEAWRGDRASWFESSQSVITVGGRWAPEMSRAERAPAYLAQTALGQREVRMTPLHLAMWAAAIANGGNLMMPTVVRAIQDEHGKKLWQFEPQVLSRAMSEETARHLTVMMEQVVESPRGTGHPAWTRWLRIAGKTGTPQEDIGSHDAIFIAFAPVEEPRLAVAVVLEDTAQGGGRAAGPIVKELLRMGLTGRNSALWQGA